MRILHRADGSEKRFRGAYPSDLVNVIDCAYDFSSEQERDALKEKLAVARDALQDLYDYQNGPPLTRYEKQWGEAMQKSRDALAALDRVLEQPLAG